MGLNIEIKARCRDLNSVEQTIQKRHIPFLENQQQKDTFFNVPNGRLKLRETEKGAWLIPYIREDSPIARSSNYALLQINDDLKNTMEILKNMFGIGAVVQKSRKIYMHENVRIHLDTVDNLGTFIELEGVVSTDNDRSASKQKVERLMKLLDIKQEDLLRHAYVDMLTKTGAIDELIR